MLQPGHSPKLLSLTERSPPLFTCLAWPACVQECLRLLVAIAGIHRKSEGAFSPSNYDVSDTISGLVHGIRLLRPAELAAAAAACSAFDWCVRAMAEGQRGGVQWRC